MRPSCNASAKWNRKCDYLLSERFIDVGYTKLNLYSQSYPHLIQPQLGHPPRPAQPQININIPTLPHSCTTGKKKYITCYENEHTRGLLCSLLIPCRATLHNTLPALPASLLLPPHSPTHPHPTPLAHAFLQLVSLAFVPVCTFVDTIVSTRVWVFTLHSIRVFVRW